METLLNYGEILVTSKTAIEKLKFKIEVMEKDIVYLKGSSRNMAMDKYHEIVKPLLKESVYLTRSE